MEKTEKKINAVLGTRGEPRGGVLAAIMTPTDADGALMKGSLGANLDFLKGAGIGGLMVLGSTGEFVRISKRVKIDVLEGVAERNAGDFPMVANCSANSVAEVRELARVAQGLGYAGISLMPQWFFAQPQEDMLEFFLRCAEGCELPFLLYNFPERTGNRIGPETVDEFAKRADMFAIKQSGAEFSYINELVEIGGRRNFAVFAGADTRIPEIMKLGCAGCIGGLTNIVPEYMGELYSLSKGGGKGERIETLSERMREVGKIIDRAGFPINVAFGMAARGLEAGVPKSPLGAGTKAQGDGIISELRALFTKWGLPMPSAV